MATFGKTAIGGAPGPANITANYKQVSKYSLGETGTVSSMSLYLDGGGAPAAGQVLRGVIYADSSGPAGFQAQTEEITVTDGASAAWFTANLTSPVTLAAGDYWLGFIAGATDAAARLYYDVVTNTRKYNADTYADGPADPFGTVEATDDVEMSVYATYVSVVTFLPFQPHLRW